MTTMGKVSLIEERDNFFLVLLFLYTRKNIQLELHDRLEHSSAGQLEHPGSASQLEQCVYRLVSTSHSPSCIQYMLNMIEQCYYRVVEQTTL